MSSNRSPKIYESPLNNDENNCKDFELRATLQKPNESVIKEINEGDILSIRVNQAPLSIEALNYRDEVCGIVTSSDVDQLVECIQKGFNYHAIVIGVREAVCVVKITNTNK